ncbi:hypothetical protein WL31_10765 [Burkholderia ubonensis]|nr:hypothetical protein WL31_10765 [Burkholderia ubonensis]
MAVQGHALGLARDHGFETDGADVVALTTPPVHHTDIGVGVAGEPVSGDPTQQALPNRNTCLLVGLGGCGGNARVVGVAGLVGGVCAHGSVLSCRVVDLPFGAASTRF